MQVLIRDRAEFKRVMRRPGVVVVLVGPDLLRLRDLPRRRPEFVVCGSATLRSAATAGAPRLNLR